MLALAHKNEKNGNRTSVENMPRRGKKEGKNLIRENER